jgi:hypothetical protein
LFQRLWSQKKLFHFQSAIVVSLFLVTVNSHGYIPSARMILDRVAESALKTPLFVEQDVTILSADQSVSVKEQWLFENENSIRLIVRGEKDLKEQIVFQTLFSDNQKTTTLSGLLQTQRSPRGPLEKIFFFKGTENLMRFLVQQSIVGDEIYRSQNFKKIPGNVGFQYQPEAFLRLGRLGGSVAYVFGPPPKGDAISPGFWVEQDQFHVLKLRNANGDEMRSEKPTTYSRSAKWPKELSYNWGSGGSAAQAQVQVINVRMAEASHRQLFQKNADKRSADFERHTGRYLIEEFYQRFR